MSSIDVMLLSPGDLKDDCFKDKEVKGSHTSMPPLGLLYLAQVLHDDGFSVKVYDQNVTNIKNDDLMEKVIKKLDPKIIGFSMCLHNYFTSVDLIRKVKDWNPNVITIAGNYTATFYSDKMMGEESKLDYCMRGEAEFNFRDFVNCVLRKKGDIKDIKGLVYRENGIIKVKDIPPNIKDVDTLPIPDRRLVDFNYKMQRKSTSIMTSRGCPHNCKFCYFASIMGKRWRPRSVESIIEELDMLRGQGIREILFGDSNSTYFKKRTLKLCSMIKKEKLDEISYFGDVRVDRVDYDILRALAQVNFGKVLFGIESGNQRILDYYNKGTTIAQIKQAVKTAQKAKMDVVFGSFIVGAPDETLDEVINTIKFANKLDLTFSAFQVLSTIPISSIYHELVQKGYKPKKDDWKGWVFASDISKEAVPRKRLEALINEGFVRFWKNPLRNLRLVWRSLSRDIYLQYIFDTIKNTVTGGRAFQ